MQNIPIITGTESDEKAKALRGRRVNLALQFISNMLCGPVAQTKTPEQIFEYAMALVGNVEIYVDPACAAEWVDGKPLN